MPRLIAGIDTGTKTGLALWDVEKQCFEVIKTTSIIEAQEILRYFNNRGLREIWFEDARLRGGNAYTCKLQGVGSVKRDGAIWQEFCEYHKISYKRIKPEKGNTKWSAVYFKQQTGWTKRTDEHGRDAGVLVWKAR